jgi:hypothetical protein
LVQSHTLARNGEPVQFFCGSTDTGTGSPATSRQRGRCCWQGREVANMHNKTLDNTHDTTAGAHTLLGLVAQLAGLLRPCGALHPHNLGALAALIRAHTRTANAGGTTVGTHTPSTQPPTAGRTHRVCAHSMLANNTALQRAAVGGSCTATPSAARTDTMTGHVPVLPRAHTQQEANHCKGKRRRSTRDRQTKTNARKTGGQSQAVRRSPAGGEGRRDTWAG